MNVFFVRYRLNEVRFLFFFIFFSSLPVCLLFLVVIDFISVEFFSFAVQRWDSGLKAKEFTRNSAEYPDRFGYLWKAAAVISLEICVAVLGMAASLSNFAKEKTL